MVEYYKELNEDAQEWDVFYADGTWLATFLDEETADVLLSHLNRSKW